MNIHGKHEYSPRGFAPQPSARNIAYMNIARIRKARGLNQTQLAEMAGITQSTMSRAENADDSVTLGNYKAIAEALNVRLSDLFSDSRTAAEQAVLDAYRRLPPDRQKGWQDMLALALSDQGGSTPGTAQDQRR